MKKLFYIVISIACLCLLQAASLAMAQEASDLTTANKTALANAVARLQHTELHRISRGRLKPDPIPLPLHTIYQNVMQNQDLLLAGQSDTFANSLIRLQKVFSDYGSEENGRDSEIVNHFRNELLEKYNIEDELHEQETILGVWRIMEGSRLGMQALPVRAALALGSRRWISSYYAHSSIPPGVSERLIKLEKRSEAPKDPFELDRYLRELSTEYAQLFADIAAGKTRFETDNDIKEN